MSGCQLFTDIDGYTWYSDTDSGSDSTSEYGTGSSDITVVSSDSDSTTNQGPLATDTNSGTYFYTDSATTSGTSDSSTDSIADSGSDFESESGADSNNASDTTSASGADTNSDIGTDLIADTGTETDTADTDTPTADTTTTTPTDVETDTPVDTGSDTNDTVDTSDTESPFLNGPCIVSVPEGESHVYAIASDGQKSVYTRTTSEPNDWSKVSGLTNSKINVLSDIDCAANASGNVFRLSTLGIVGEVYEATGSGVLYNDFVELFDGALTSPSVTVGYNDAVFNLAATAAFNVEYLYQETSYPACNYSYNLTSGVDGGLIGQNMGLEGWIVFFNENDQLILHRAQLSSATAQFCQVSQYARALSSLPDSNEFEYSPAVCIRPIGYGTQMGYVVVAGGGDLWVSTVEQGTAAQSLWEAVELNDVASSPDCSVESDGTANIVVRGTDGNIFHVRGTPGTWEFNDLGTL